ncbi:MAG: SAM-dependent DNA methyltransferase [Colwellia sp.]|nr:SAM-dependent DNA methyltransferase [Colwellia sp.]
MIWNTSYSFPDAGKSLYNKIKTKNKPYNDICNGLISILSRDCIDELFSILKLEESVFSKEEVVSRYLGALCLSFILLSNLEKKHSIQNVLYWFCQKKLNISANVQQEIEQFFIIEFVDVRDIDESTIHFLPYILEPFEPLSRSDIEKSSEAKLLKKKRKKLGVFYTPSDISKFMCDYVTTEDIMTPNEKTFYDPCCGTGIFLLGLLNELAKQQEGISYFELAKQHLFGNDKCNLSVELCVLVIFTVCSYHENGNIVPFKFINRIKRNFTNLDAYDLTIDSSKQYSAIIINPPYIKVKNYKQRSFIGYKGDSIPFELICIDIIDKKLKDKGKAIIITPLSVSYSHTKPYTHIRNYIHNSSAEWEFYFYDRQPHALFGEGVKTRNSIIACKKTEFKSLKTTRLLRWRSFNRQSCWDRNPLNISNYDIINGIPKVENEFELELITSFNKVNLDKDMIRFDKSSYEDLNNSEGITISNTAYNFINCFLKLPDDKNSSIVYSSSPLHHLKVTGTKKFELYALLSSTTFFLNWFWNCDGFHLTKSFLENNSILKLNFSLEERTSLQLLGEMLWEDRKKNYKYTINASKTTVSFGDVFSKTEDIDKLILNHLGIFRANSIEKLTDSYKNIVID